MMIPEAWENHTQMEPGRRDFYRFHGWLMEPWDGPAAVIFTDGTVAGASSTETARPARYWVTDDGLVVLASEVGVLDIDPATVVRKVGSSRAGCSWSTRPRVGSWTTRRSRPGWRPSNPMGSGLSRPV